MKFIVKKLIRMILTIWFVYTAVFFLSRLTGDPVDFILPEGSTVEKLELREKLGLNDPILVQYIKSIINIFKGDFGISYYSRIPVSQMFMERLGPTLILGSISFIIIAVFGIFWGTITALNHNSKFDKSVVSILMAIDAIPGFVLAIVLIFIFSLKLRILPSSGKGSALTYIMPLITMSVGPICRVARLTRSSMLDILNQDFIVALRAKGLKRFDLIFHALRNALIPVITILGAQLGDLIGGSTVVETVFAWPGVGSWLVNSAKNRDFPVMVFGVLIMSTSVTFVNLLVDISYTFLDPRITIDKEE